MVKVFGLRNCDTCRKARRWLDDQRIEHVFHDMRIDGLDPVTLDGWIAALGWDTLVNRRGTTWRNLPDEEKSIADPKAGAALMMSHPALIKRPVFAFGTGVLVGFDDDARAALLATRSG